MKKILLISLLAFSFFAIGCANPKADRSSVGSNTSQNSSSSTSEDASGASLQTTVSGATSLSSNLSEQISELLPSLSNLFSSGSSPSDQSNLNLDELLGLFSEKVESHKKELAFLEVSVQKQYNQLAKGRNPSSLQGYSRLNQSLHEIELMKAQIQQVEKILNQY